MKWIIVSITGIFSAILKEAQINSLGMCEECIIVSIPDDILIDLKENQLEEIENRWKDYD